MPQFGFQMGTHRHCMQQEERLVTLYVEFLAENEIDQYQCGCKR